MFLAIVPAYNEEKHIGSVVRDLFSHVDGVVVVDDGSTDSTSIQAREAGATIIKHSINRGQGAALETGHEYARTVGADYILHFDGDAQFSVEDIVPALRHLQNTESDILFGSRFLGVNSRIPFFKKHVILPVARRINSLFSGTRLSDAHNGFRILNKRALLSVRISQHGMAHATEIPAQAAKHNLSITEFPVHVIYHEYGQGTAGGMRILRDLLLHKFIQ